MYKRNRGERLRPPDDDTSRRSPSAVGRETPVATVLWYGAAATCVWSFGYARVRASDLWWHLAGGRWMVEHGALRVDDPFSFTAAGKRWLNDSWLSDVLLHLWAEHLGLFTLVYWKWSLMVVTWLVIFRVAWRLSGDAVATSGALVLGLGVAAPFLDLRPQLYSFLGWAVLLHATLATSRPPSWLPLLFLCWANLHAGFSIGLVALPIVLAPHYLAAPGAERRRLVLVAGLSVAACLVNPNGFEVVVRPLRYAFDESSPFRVLGEWLPPFRRGGIQSPLFPYALGATMAAGSVWLWERRAGLRGPRTLAPLALAILTAAMALRSRRFVPFFAMTQILVTAPALARLLAPALRRVPPLVAPIALLALGTWWMRSLPVRPSAFERLTAYREFPIAACARLTAEPGSGNVFAFYNWGGFLQHCAHGRFRVFIDGRADTLYDDQTFRDYLVVLRQEPGWQRIVEGSAAHFVLWPAQQAGVPNALVELATWRVVHRDATSILLARASQ